MAHQDADSRVPRYLQVASVLRRRIRDGHWLVGDKIATLEELEREFNVARVTVRQAIDLLQGEGLVKSFQGRGTFVTKAVQNDRWMQLATDWESLIAPIRDHVPNVLPSEPRPVPRIEEGDGTPAPAYVFLRSVQKRAGKPYAYARVHVAKHIYAKGPKLFSSRVALAVLSEMKNVAICARAPDGRRRRSRHRSGPASGDRAQRADGRGALRRDRQERRHHLHRRDYLSRRLRAAQHRAHRPGRRLNCSPLRYPAPTG